MIILSHTHIHRFQAHFETSLILLLFLFSKKVLVFKNSERNVIEMVFLILQVLFAQNLKN